MLEHLRVPLDREGQYQRYQRCQEKVTPCGIPAQCPERFQDSPQSGLGGEARPEAATVYVIMMVELISWGDATKCCALKYS